MHHCWHREGKTDLSVFRLDANRRLVDKHHPEETTIHIHPHGLSCGKYEHEEYKFPEQKDTTEEQGTPVKAVLTWNDEDHDGPRL